jgi:peptidyl-prolyl cis-trans isomerase C
MGEAAFNLEVGKISDPVPVGRNWSVVKLNEKIAPAPKSFEESKTSIRIKMEREERTRRQEAWRKEIETKVPVKIFKEKLSTLFADVEQDIKEDELSDRTDPKTGQLKRKSNGEPIKPEDY